VRLRLPAGVQRQAVQGAAEQLPTDLDFEGGSAGLRVAAAAAGPEFRQAGGQADGGAVEQVGAAEAPQQRQGLGLAGQDVVDGVLQDGAEAVGGLGVKRWSRPWGLMGVPTVTAAWARSSRVARGLSSQPKTRAWVKLAPVSWRCRRTKPVSRAAWSATEVRRVCKVSASCGTVSIRGGPVGDWWLS
jgi:hypothetical protein